MDFDNNTELTADYSLNTNNPEIEESETPYYFENKHEIVTRVAFLCGVGDHHLTGENSAFLSDVIESLSKDTKALLIRHLSNDSIWFSSPFIIYNFRYGCDSSLKTVSSNYFFGDSNSVVDFLESSIQVRITLVDKAQTGSIYDDMVS